MSSDQPKCDVCSNTGWVCENHADRPWEGTHRDCGCGGAGMPCKDCNPCDYEHPPRMLPGSTIICDLDGYRH